MSNILIKSPFWKLFLLSDLLMIWNISIIQRENCFVLGIFTLWWNTLVLCQWIVVNDISYFPILFQSQIGNCFSMYGIYYLQERMLNDKVLLMASPCKAWLIFKSLDSTLQNKFKAFTVNGCAKEFFWKE